MIHLIGLVFQGGLGIPLYADKDFDDNGSKSTLIYALSTAITSFASGVITRNIKGRSELISGDIRLIVYDPFVDLTTQSADVDPYVFMALQDLYDNLEISFTKLIEIHRNILVPLGLNTPHASLNFKVTSESYEKIKKIALRTQIFPTDNKLLVKEIFQQFLATKSAEVAFLALILADIDGGMLVKAFARDLYEDPAFSELLLSNMVAENPADAITVWIERNAPFSIVASIPGFPTKGVKEVFAMLHIGKSPSDFRLLARVVCIPTKMDFLREQLRQLSDTISTKTK